MVVDLMETDIDEMEDEAILNKIFELNKSSKVDFDLLMQKAQAERKAQAEKAQAEKDHAEQAQAEQAQAEQAQPEQAQPDKK